MLTVSPRRAPFGRLEAVMFKIMPPVLISTLPTIWGVYWSRNESSSIEGK